jgi:hypothetical protein|tara:strand:+ start:541 stop:720 length:180 start_codon:yes stop_codon:yes gene_type:complete
MKDTIKITYKRIAKDQVKGRAFFVVTETETDMWPIGMAFSDDDMSMGSYRGGLRFVEDK